MWLFQCPRCVFKIITQRPQYRQSIERHPYSASFFDSSQPFLRLSLNSQPKFNLWIRYQLPSRTLRLSRPYNGDFGRLGMNRAHNTNLDLLIIWNISTLIANTPMPIVLFPRKLPFLEAFHRTSHNARKYYSSGFPWYTFSSPLLYHRWEKMCLIL